MVARLAGLLLLVLGLLPIANWIPGGHEAPWYGERLALWTSGGAILLGIAVVAAIVFRRRPSLWRPGLWHGLGLRWQAGGWKADLAIAVVGLVAYGTVSQLILSAKPLLIDEIIQVWQARVLASGRLWVPTPEHPEFTAAMHLVDLAGRRFGQFPVGGPAMLMLGTLVGAEWLVGPFFAAVAVFAFARLLRHIEPGAGVGLAAVLLFAFAPFWLFLGGSMMNHVTVTAWLLVAAWALATAVRDERARWCVALTCGLALGVAATIRPMDAAAFALPTAAWLFWRVRAGRAHLIPLLASGVGVAVPLAALLYVNAQQTGDPLLFGYLALWGKSHALGFHEVPWGEAHTPLRGLELVNLYLLRLQTYFLETPAPALLFATAALLLVRRRSALDRWMLAGSGLLLVSYWAYWHDGFYLGPRFLLPLAPWLALWTVRLPAVLADRGVAPWARQGVVTAGVAALVMGGAMLAPIRAGQYRNGMYNLRVDLDALASAQGVTRGTVLVRESWGAQLIARLWAAGVSRTEAEGIYRTTDACALDAALDAAEREAPPTMPFADRVALARADSARLVGLRGMPDTTARVLPGAAWRAACGTRLRDDQQGLAVYPPALLVRPDGPRFVKDLHRRPPGSTEPYFLLRKPNAVGAAFELLPLSADSLTRAWEDPDAP